ncbi:MAG TPA: thioesterase family protein [Planctomycetota bacterium]|nr:thioesterase family protein [Planctomycetota bacterium]
MSSAETIPAPADDGSDEAWTEVRYGETDQMGYAHHATAVLWLEYGRVHWLRKRGLSYRDLEAAGILLPVVSMAIKYHAPGRFEDQLVIRTRLVDLGKSRVSFESSIHRAEAGGERTLLVTGTVELVCLNKQGRIQRVPPEFERIWKQISNADSPQPKR